MGELWVSSSNGETEFNIDYVAGNLSRVVALSGSDTAIFTFVLVFLYPRYASDQLNGVLFQVTLTSALIGIFLFVIAGLNYFEVIMAEMSVTRKRALARRADHVYVSGVLTSTTMPALILFTLNIPIVAIIATALWTISACLLLLQRRRLRFL